MNKNPFSTQESSGSQLKTVFYIAPEDLRDKLSGGHIESLTDSYLLSEIYKNVIVLYPDENIKKPNYLYEKISLEKNIRFQVVSKNKSYIYKFLLSEKRASYIEILSIIREIKDADIFVACHRNLLAHLIIYKHLGKKHLFFKSYGSIFLHNLDNLYAIARTKCIEPLFFKRLLSTIIYLFFEHFSYLFCSKVFITRDISNVKRNLLGKFYDSLFGSKTIYKVSGPYWYFKKKEKNAICEYSRRYEKNGIIKIGSLGDNTFPTAILGMCFLLKELDRVNQLLNKQVIIDIAGKSNKKSISTIKKIKIISNIKINFLGYVEDKDEFINSLDGMILPVSGGSAMPIKAIEAMLRYKRPILVTKYIWDSCSGFFKESKNIYFRSDDYLAILS